tara:strand:- start:1209 stop:1706 length:498 start_codon:yes stop_codon:yes gene_type:complete
MSAKRKKKGGSAGCDRPISPWHGEDGKFVNPDEKTAGSWSCEEKGQTSRRGRSKRFTKVPCGRKARAAGKNVRCHDGKVIDEDLFGYIRGLVEEELLGQVAEPTSPIREYERLHIPTLRREFKKQIEGTKSGLLDEENCARCIQNYLRSLNAAIQSSKGELGKSK